MFASASFIVPLFCACRHLQPTIKMYLKPIFLEMPAGTYMLNLPFKEHLTLLALLICACRLLQLKLKMQIKAHPLESACRHIPAKYFFAGTFSFYCFIVLNLKNFIEYIGDVPTDTIFQKCLQAIYSEFTLSNASVLDISSILRARRHILSKIYVCRHIPVLFSHDAVCHIC